MQYWMDESIGDPGFSTIKNALMLYDISIIFQWVKTCDKHSLGVLKPVVIFSEKALYYFHPENSKLHWTQCWIKQLSWFPLDSSNVKLSGYLVRNILSILNHNPVKWIRPRSLDLAVSINIQLKSNGSNFHFKLFFGCHISVK